MLVTPQVIFYYLSFYILKAHTHDFVYSRHYNTIIMIISLEILLQKTDKMPIVVFQMQGFHYRRHGWKGLAKAEPRSLHQHLVSFTLKVASPIINLPP